VSVQLHRALGAVVGSAVGDALGAPFEFGPPGEYSARFPAPVLGGTGEMAGGGGFGWSPGEFTDDTQMALVQAESLLARDGLDGADLFARFRAWAADASDVGNQTRAALSSGLPWPEAAEAYFAAHPNGSAGNGGVMRATPSAVFAAEGDLAESMELGRRLAAVTHGDPAAQWGAALLHGLVHVALRGDDPFSMLASLLERLPAGQERFVAMLDHGWSPSLGGPGNGSVWTCLAQAVWAVRTTDSFADAVVAAIDLGGDTDTVAAVAGGLAGAVYGIQAIPSRWTTYLNGTVRQLDGSVRAYGNADLQELTRRLLGHPPLHDTPFDPPRGPAPVDERLWAADLSQAATVPTDWAVVSLCRTYGLFAGHPRRREVFAIDHEGANPGLHHVLDDVVATIDAFLAEGGDVVVHCHGGRSRTGLALRAWLMHCYGWDEPTATAEALRRWPHLVTWTDDFTRALRTWRP
jgi:ADP-ribosyl-[dinitrogen reductase] hydrolase